MGELYREHITYLFNLIGRYPHNRIIVFPQTVHYVHAELLKADAEKLRAHPDLHFCVRDEHGYQMLRPLLPHVMLLPDMTACIPLDFFNRWHVSPKGSLLLKRRDAELAQQTLDLQTDHVADWPTFYHRLTDGTFIAKIIDRLCRACPKLFGPLWDWYADHVYRPDLLRIGTRFIKRFDPIYTTRLHGMLLALMCGKHVTVIDNSYGKNFNYVNTWLNDVEEVTLYSHIKE